jgi:hypothetical protein
MPKFSDSPSHRIFERMHEALNIDSLDEMDETNLLSLIRL